MRISVKWLSEFLDLSEIVGPTRLADLLTQRGLEVESIERLDQGFEKVVSAQILEKNPHPQSDRLSLCKVTLGFGDPLEIVCGAQNMKAGDRVALAQVGASLPNGVKISQSKIRGIISNGMLCSEAELKLSTEGDGILILPASTPLGEPLAKILGRDDTILTLKLTANRGDCLSYLGIARELGSALGQKPKKPSILPLNFEGSPISVNLNAGEASPQFLGCLIEGIHVGPSPEWLVRKLEAQGSRSINNVVDASNLVMLEFGHPMHAYDAEKICGEHLEVRVAQAGEILPLLDGQTITLSGFELIIADGEKAVGLAGVMGGGNSEVHPNSTSIFIECAEFEPTLVRRSASQHSRRTDASQRFERGVNPAGLSEALARLAFLVIQLAGGKIAGAVAKQLPSRQPGASIFKKEICFQTYFIHDFLGFERDLPPLTLEKTEEILKGLDCQVKRQGEEWWVSPPSYRLDLTLPEDIAEEIARSLGYDQIPTTLPKLSSSPTFGASSRSRVALLDRTKDILSRSGLYETVNFSFTSKAWLARFGFAASIRILNPLSEEHEVMVPSLIPGLVRNVLENWNHHFGSEPLAVRLFELRPTFLAPAGVQATSQLDTGVEERWKLALALTGPRYAQALKSERGEFDFYDLKAILDYLVKELGCRGVRYQPMEASRMGNPLFHPGQSVEVIAGNSVAGHFGLIHPAKAKELKVRAPLWLAELDWEVLVRLSRQAFDSPSFKSWSEFPSIERDFALVVKSEVTADKICQLAMKTGKPLIKGAKVFDIYKGSQVVQGMTSVAVRVIFYDECRSLQESEAEAASARILETWKRELGAELRS